MKSSTWSALGNTYLLVETAGDQPLDADRVRRLCRDVDGAVEVLRASGSEADVIIWNRDGSTAELSGNGTRIAARWLAGRTGSSRAEIRVGGRRVAARILDDGAVETDLGAVTVGPPEWVDAIEVIRVRVGNPHAVVPGDPSEIEQVGPLLVDHPRFPEGTNVEVARVDAPGEVAARVWERGVGETPASGTGAVAVAAATHGEGNVLVRFPGGELLVHLDHGRATVTGPAEPA